MTGDAYKAAFEQAVGFPPDETLLERVEAAQAAGMDDRQIMDCLACEAAVARTLGGIYGRAYGEARAQEKAGAVVYRRMRAVWKEENGKKAAPG